MLVNAHGALILLSTEVTVGQRLTLADVRTEQKRECRVVMIGFRTSNMNQVGVELLEPFDGFWRALKYAKRLGAVPGSAEAKCCYVRSKVARPGHLFGAFVQGIHLRRRNRITRSDQDP